MSDQLSPFFVLYPKQSSARSMAGEHQPLQVHEDNLRCGTLRVIGVHFLDFIEDNHGIALMLRNVDGAVDAYRKYGSYLEHAGRQHSQHHSYARVWTDCGTYTLTADRPGDGGVYPRMMPVSAPTVICSNIVLRDFIQEKLVKGHEFDVIKDFLHGVQILMHTGGSESHKLQRAWGHAWGDRQNAHPLFEGLSAFEVESVGLRLANSCLVKAA